MVDVVVTVVSVAIESILGFDWDSRGGRGVGRRDSEGAEILLGEAIGVFTKDRDVVEIRASGTERVEGREVEGDVDGVGSFGNEAVV